MTARLVRRSLLALPIALAGGCTPVYVVSSSAPDEYTLVGTSPYGLYGGLIDLHPSTDAMTVRAAQYCPNGYDKTSDSAGRNWQDGNTLDWHIRCRPSPSPQ